MIIFFFFSLFDFHETANKMFLTADAVKMFEHNIVLDCEWNVVASGSITKETRVSPAPLARLVLLMGASVERWCRILASSG